MERRLFLHVFWHTYVFASDFVKVTCEGKLAMVGISEDLAFCIDFVVENLQYSRVAVYGEVWTLQGHKAVHPQMKWGEVGTRGACS